MTPSCTRCTWTPRRIQQMKEEQEKRREMQSKGHGTYVDRASRTFSPGDLRADILTPTFTTWKFDRPQARQA